MSSLMQNFVKMLFLLGVLSFPSLNVAAKAQLPTIVGRASVIDGDTIEIRGERIRLFGIDAPESSQLCQDAKGNDYRCGQKSAFALSDRIGSRTVTCQPTGLDRWRRTIAICKVSDTDLQELMVSNGLAVAFVRYSRDYVEAEEAAKSRSLGMWAGSFMLPWEWRRRPQK
jgi:endonuclease YncB( thermonuclease family)